MGPSLHINELLRRNNDAPKAANAFASVLRHRGKVMLLRCSALATSATQNQNRAHTVSSELRQAPPAVAFVKPKKPRVAVPRMQIEQSVRNLQRTLTSVASEKSLMAALAGRRLSSTAHRAVGEVLPDLAEATERGEESDSEDEGNSGKPGGGGKEESKAKADDDDIASEVGSVTSTSMLDDGLNTVFEGVQSPSSKESREKKQQSKKRAAAADGSEGVGEGDGAGGAAANGSVSGAVTTLFDDPQARKRQLLPPLQDGEQSQSQSQSHADKPRGNAWRAMVRVDSFGTSMGLARRVSVSSTQHGVTSSRQRAAPGWHSSTTFFTNSDTSAASRRMRYAAHDDDGGWCLALRVHRV